MGSETCRYVLPSFNGSKKHALLVLSQISDSFRKNTSFSYGTGFIRGVLKPGAHPCVPVSLFSWVEEHPRVCSHQRDAQALDSRRLCQHDRAEVFQK